MSRLDQLFSTLRTSASGLAAERVRVGVIAENIAGARITKTPEGGPYRRKVVLFEPLLDSRMGGSASARGVRAARIETDTTTPFEDVHDPSHPHADEHGNVRMPNVNPLKEMADLIGTMRSYEANLGAQENFLRMAQRALELAR
jgi:flagellar basal-body rod protein FlgC